MHSITSYNRIVIKIGSAVLADSDGRVNHTILSSISEDVAWLIKNGKEVLIVSSGAIALGRKKIKFSENLTPNSKVKASYVSDPNTKYNYIVNEDYSNSLKLSMTEKFKGHATP